MSRGDPTVARLQALLTEQAALRRVATLAAAEFDAARLFAVVCEELGRVLQVESTDMLRFDDDGKATVVGAWAAEGAVLFSTGQRISVEGQSVTAKLHRTRRPQRVDDYEGIEGEVADLLLAQGVRSVVGAPVSLAGELWGAVMVSSKTPHCFPPETEQRVADFAELVAAALASADAREQLAASRARIVEAGYEERRRIGRDLHDGAQQELVGAVISLKLARDKVDDPSGEAGELLDAALEQTRAGIRDLRELAAGVHPSVLADRGLCSALQALAGRSQVPVTVQADGCDDLPSVVATTAYFVVAEALTNAVKHSACEGVEVVAGTEDGYAVVEVRDDGVGGADPAGGTGLSGLADRVNALGGRIDIHSPPGEGTTVVARIALHRDEPGEAREVRLPQRVNAS